MMPVPEHLFLLIRHPESASNCILHDADNQLLHSPELAVRMKAVGGDSQISDKGYKQADVTAQYLGDRLSSIIEQEKCILHIYSSNLQCTTYLTTRFRTSAPFVFAYDHTNLDELNEYSRSGGQETAQEFLQRVATFTQSLRRAASTTRLLEDSNGRRRHIHFIFGHSLFFSRMLSYCAQENQLHGGSPVTSEVDKILTDFELPNCSISCLSLSPRREKLAQWHILGVGCQAHLSPELQTGEF